MRYILELYENLCVDFGDFSNNAVNHDIFRDYSISVDNNDDSNDNDKDNEMGMCSGNASSCVIDGTY